jgi:hypothetical protein
MFALNIGIVVVRKAEKPTMSGSFSLIASTNFSGGTFTPEVDDREAGALEHDVAEVLADVVHVALDRPHQELAHRLGARGGQQRSQDVERALHRARGDQHLGHEVVAALEARADLLQRGDQRVVEQVLRVHPVREPLLDALLDGGCVAHERLLVEEREDLVVRHAA